MCKKGKCWLAVFCIACTVLSGMLFGGLFVLKTNLPESYQLVQGDTLDQIGNLPVTGEKLSHQNAKTVQNTLQDQKEYQVRLKLFGVFPITDASVKVVDAYNVQLAGDPFGIKIYTQGVLIVGMTDVDTKQGPHNPAAQAGLKTGDVLLSINGTMVTGNAQVAQLVANSGGAAMAVTAQRDDKNFTTTLNPVFSESEQKFRAGIWVRDSSAGIGTLTFYDPTNRVVAGLGHGICDVDTGDILPIASGQLVPARILNVRKGEKGSPGELTGCFSGGVIGQLLANEVTGVYGTAENYPLSGQLIPVAMKQEIKAGKAQIVTTVAGERSTYNCIIEKVHFNNDSLIQNMVIRITDETLLQQTGGIVQGMSGSPILQNGKLIGAVTHVLLNDPTRGYGIFAENMLETAQSVAQEQLKDAS